MSNILKGYGVIAKLRDEGLSSKGTGEIPKREKLGCSLGEWRKEQ